VFAEGIKKAATKKGGHMRGASPIKTKKKVKKKEEGAHVSEGVAGKAVPQKTSWVGPQTGVKMDIPERLERDELKGLQIIRNPQNLYCWGGKVS